MTAANNIVRIGDGRVRLSDDELHKRACKAIWEGNHVVFESLPTLVAQIIENKVWRSYQHKDFASYALDATSNGLGINTNQRLWILRCAMDVQHYDKATEKMVPGEHIKEWTGVLTKVEEMVRIEAKKSGRTMRSFEGNSLEMLAKNVDSTIDAGLITYLPSGQKGGGVDGVLARLHRNKPDILKRVVSGELSVSEARREAGLAGNSNGLSRAKSVVRNMTAKERREFIDWLKEEGYLE